MIDVLGSHLLKATSLIKKLGALICDLGSHLHCAVVLTLNLLLYSLHKAFSNSLTPGYPVNGQQPDASVDSPPAISHAVPRIPWH